ncbi:immunoglobulin superfamily member 10 [Hyperolius riggenbachi]|uniref:immunoglobulin superfamily member 10 n=1 Tax=Hyperolius riggenbachi TaxID=752182 RepID=UPI0035A341EB
MMLAMGRSSSCLPGYLVILWILGFTDPSRACPKPCACYAKTEVHCTFRYLGAIPKAIQTDVERINLGYNSISRLTESDLSGLQKLELLMLHSNEINTIHEDAFRDLSSLQVLKMSYNKVKTLHRNTFRGLKSLVRLHMDHNKLEFLAPESFYGLTNLKLVHLEGNALRQLHTDSFVTLRYIHIFKTSSIKQIYLSDNQLFTLPKEMFFYLNDLEGLYLHGNPWTCDCNLQWLTELGLQSRDLIKCKRDRSGHQCPICTSPQKNKGKSLNDLSSQDLICTKPTIDNVLKLKNVSTPEEGSFTTISAKDFVAPMGSLVLNMTDQSGNEANLACTVQRPMKMSEIRLDKKEEYTILRTTFSSFLVCNLDYDHIQKLWGILAMYSDSPMKLKRDLLLTKTPFISYKYKQVGSGDDVFTDIEAELRAEPNWLMQDLVTLQLDRSATTLNMLHIQYLTDVYVTIPDTAQHAVKNNWVMITKGNQTQTEYSTIVGGTVEMNCQAGGEPTPITEWVLPDGSKIRAPYVSEEGRITITKDGKFILKSADSFDTGVYHCIATNYMDADVLTYRITVVSADVEEEAVNGAELSVFNGDVLYLPCGFSGVPDASVSWILPDHSILHETLRNKFIFSNGTLRIQDITQRDRGHFRCIAANQYGLDVLTHMVFVKERENGRVSGKLQLDQTEDKIEDGSGTEEVKENNYLATGKITTHRKFPTRRINTKLDSQGNLNTEVHQRNRVNPRLKGHRRPFTPNTRRIDPQRWTEILEKTKKNSVSSQTPAQVTESSAKEESITENVSGEPYEASGEELLPEKEQFLVVSEKPSKKHITTTTGPTATPRYTPSLAAKETSTASSFTKIYQDNLAKENINKETTVTITKSTSLAYSTKRTGSPHYVDTFTDTTNIYNYEEPTTLSILNTTSVVEIPAPETTTKILHMSSSDATTNALLKPTPFTSPGKFNGESQDATTGFKSLTATPQIVVTGPTTTSGVSLTTTQKAITPSPASPIASSKFYVTTQNQLLTPTIPENEVQFTTHDDTKRPSTTSSYFNNQIQYIVSSPPSEVNFMTTSPPNSITNPDIPPYDLSTHTPFTDPLITSRYVHVTSQSIQGKPQSSSTTKIPLRSAAVGEIAEPPTTFKPTITNKVIVPQQDILNSQIATTPSSKTMSTQKTTTPSTTRDRFDSKQESELLTDSQDRRPTQPNVHSIRKSLHSDTRDKLGEENVHSTDSLTKSSTKVYLSKTDIGQIYIHTTQKIISPKLSPGSTIISHQQIQIVKDVTPLIPTLRNYGRRRIPGRRRIIKPGRVPSSRIHQFKFGKADIRENTESTTSHSTTSDSRDYNRPLNSTVSSRTYSTSPTQQPPRIVPGKIHVEATIQPTSKPSESEPSAATYITSAQPATHSTPQEIILRTMVPSKSNMDMVRAQDVTTYIPTTVPVTTNEGRQKTTLAQMTTIRPRVTSKMIRRKIPWHRLFGNNQITQREVLRKLRKNIRLNYGATTRSPAPDIWIPQTSTASILSAQQTTTSLNTETNAPLVRTKSTTALYPRTAATRTVKSPTSASVTSAFKSKYAAAAIAINSSAITKTVSAQVFPTGTTKWTTFYPTTITPTTTAVHPTSPRKIVPITSSLARTSAYTTVEKTFKDASLPPLKHAESATVTSSPVDSTTRFKSMRRKRPRKKYHYSILQNHWKSAADSNKLATSSEETTKSYTVTPTVDFSSSTINEAQSTLVNSRNDIPLTINGKFYWSGTSKLPNLSLQTSPLTNVTSTLTTPHQKLSDNNYIFTSVQALNKNGHFKQVIASTPRTKVTSLQPKDFVNTTPYPSSVTAKIISSLTDPLPILSPTITQTPVIPIKKIVSSTVEIRRDPKTSHRNIHVIPQIPSVLKKTPHNISSTTAQEIREKTINSETETLPNDVRSRPRIMGGKAASFTVLANTDAFIPCEATGNPTPTVLWTKVSSGTFVTKTRRGNRMEVLANGTLSISSVGIQDRGQYLCVATNQYGSDRLLVSLSVITYPPRILQGKSREITVHSGSFVNVKCQAEGRPFPTITWILANETIASEKSAHNDKVFVQSDGSLTIREVSLYDRGIYKCLATNIAGADTFTVKIQVISAPPVIMEEKRQTVLALPGENVKLHCTAKGNPQPSVHWVAFDGTKVKPLQYVNTKLFLFSNGSLYVRNAAVTDNGNYECIATSSTGSERRVVSLQVEQSESIPKILHASPKATEISYGDKLVLNCSATGEPKPKIIWRLPSKAVVDQWHKMGSRIQVDPSGSLIVLSVNEKDAGDYLCVARNKMGDDVILMKVSVTMKPAKIVQKQQSIKEVPYGKDFKVDCKASGSPLPEISWSLPDGTVINNVLQADDSGRRKRRYVLFDNGTLYLDKVGMAEEGDYTCYAENTLGRDEMKVHVTVVTAAPRIKINTRTKFEVRAGGSVVLDCEAIGEPKPKIFWLLPSSDMIATSHDRYLLHENGSLTINHVKLLDAGEYMCVARNAAGDDTRLLKLNVHSTPPIINGLHTNKTIIKDSALKHSRKLIHCRAEGTPPLQIMWIIPDNIYLTAPYHGSRITIHQNGTLDIRNVRSSDSAEFTCIARNDGGESLLVVELEVLEVLRRPMFKNPFNERIIAKPGKMAILNCLADGNPTPEILWLLPNGSKFITGQKFSKFHAGTNGTLVIYSPTKDDAGRYRCAARNKVGYIEKLIILEVGQKPNILTHPRGPIKGNIGETLSLHCLSDGIPKPSVVWTLPSGYVIDRPQFNGKYRVVENGTLVIQDVNIHDRGNYLCKVKNNAGETSISVSVMIIAYPPRITTKAPQNIHTRAGSPIHLNCIAIGIPKPEITWELPDSSVLTTAGKGRPTGTELLHPQGTLVVQNPKLSDSGMYRCIARNPLGTDSSSTYLKVI